MEWIDGVQSVFVSNVLSIVWLSLCSVLPVLFGIYAYKHRADWGESWFINKFGTYFENVKTKKPEDRSPALLVILIFFARRMMLNLVIVFLQHASNV